MPIPSKSKDVWYTLGEIFRLGLLKNHKGEPYKQKPSVSNATLRLKWEWRKSPFGRARMIPMSEIERFNNHWK